MTNIDICNMALSHVNSRPIVSFDELSEPARQCQTHYELTRRMLLTSYPWGFAKKRQKLARLDIEPTPNWQYIFTYPNDCLKALWLYDETGNRHINNVDMITRFETFSIADNTRVIGCDFPKIYLEYTSNVKDVEVFSSDFIDALTYLLASKLSVALVSDPQMHQTNYQLYQVALHNAKTTEAQEKSPDYNYPDSYIKARF